MTLCTQYMHQRYKLKMQVRLNNHKSRLEILCNSIEQVSKYEKFGYGCMVTQLASTVAGITELNHCGKIFLLCICTSSRATLQKNLTIRKNDHIINFYLEWNFSLCSILNFDDHDEFLQ